METNKTSTRLKREQVKKLKEQRDRLNRQLQSYLQYGDTAAMAVDNNTNISDPVAAAAAGNVCDKIPLVNILGATLQFARQCCLHHNVSCITVVLVICKGIMIVLLLLLKHISRPIPTSPPPPKKILQYFD